MAFSSGTAVVMDPTKSDVFVVTVKTASGERIATSVA